MSQKFSEQELKILADYSKLRLVGGIETNKAVEKLIKEIEKLHPNEKCDLKPLSDPKVENGEMNITSDNYPKRIYLHLSSYSCPNWFYWVNGSFIFRFYSEDVKKALKQFWTEVGSSYYDILIESLYKKKDHYTTISRRFIYTFQLENRRY